MKLNTPIETGNYTMSGVESSKARFNILLDNATQTGLFAVVYLYSSNYMYEFTFDLDKAAPTFSN